MQVFKVSNKALLACYGVIPLTLGLMLFDILFLNSQTKAILPADPQSIFIVSVFFMLPHIIASTATFFDVGYIRHYRILLLLVILASVLLPIAVPALFGKRAFIIFILVFTAYHAIMQQFGLSKRFFKQQKGLYPLWSISGFLIYAGAYLQTNSMPSSLFFESESWVGYYVLLGIHLVAFGAVFRLTKSRQGKIACI